MIGPDGKFVLGIAAKPLDRGGFNVAIAITRYPPSVMLDFGTQVGWIANTPLEAETLISTLRLKIYGAFGEMEYVPEGFPFTVAANRVKGLIETQLPQVANVLIANPEVFLVWADKLEEALRELQPHNWRVA